MNQSARSLSREYLDDALKSLKCGYNLKKFSNYLKKGLLGVDLLFSFTKNLTSREESWFSDFLVDGAISLGIYVLPGGIFVSMIATAATFIFDDKIEEIKDWFAEKWRNFWSFL